MGSSLKPVAMQFTKLVKNANKVEQDYFAASESRRHHLERPKPSWKDFIWLNLENGVSTLKTLQTIDRKDPKNKDFYEKI